MHKLTDNNHDAENAVYVSESLLSINSGIWSTSTNLDCYLHVDEGNRPLSGGFEWVSEIMIKFNKSLISLVRNRQWLV